VPSLAVRRLGRTSDLMAFCPDDYVLLALLGPPEMAAHLRPRILPIAFIAHPSHGNRDFSMSDKLRLRFRPPLIV
jgi:hypothetical protein